ARPRNVGRRSAAPDPTRGGGCAAECRPPPPFPQRVAVAQEPDNWALPPPPAARRGAARGRRAAKQRDELAAFELRAHSISSSARPLNGSGTVMPSALAVLRLMYSSTFVPCWTGRAAGFSPFRIRAAVTPA